MTTVPFNRANEWWRHPRTWRPDFWKTGNGQNQVIAETTLGKAKWQVRLKDFPDEPCHTLLIDGAEVLHFDDWPCHWRRPGMPARLDWSKHDDNRLA